MLEVLKIRDFRLLCAGEGVSLVGDQFYLIALPWLILQMTGDALMLGGVLALQGVSRAAFMLVGGAVTDRFSPRLVMIVSNLVRLALVAAIAAGVLGGILRPWMLYPFALAFGVADGFFFPAQTAIVPQIAARDQLQPANALMQGLDQVSLFIGPVLAGVLIGAFAHGHNLTGVGYAFAIDAVSFAASVSMLLLVRVDAETAAARRAAGEPDEEAASLWCSVREGLIYMWADLTLRTLLVLVVAVNFLAVGPLLVGIPVLASTRLSEGAGGFGAIMSVFGGASLLGIVLAGALPRPSPRQTGNLLLGVCMSFGVGMAALGFARTLVGAALPVLLMGAASGYLIVMFFTWLQARTPQRMMGRMMSLLIFASVGLVPVSQALSGAFVKWSLAGLFLGAALLLAVIVGRAWFVPSLRAMGLEMATGSDQR